MISNQNVQTPKFYVRDTIRLGHCRLRLGEIEKAGQVFQHGLDWAINQNDLRATAEFEYNLGHVRYYQGRWTDALKSYLLAVQHARESEFIELVGEALFVMARLRARQGDFAEAFGEIERSLRIMERVYANDIRQAQAFVYAGDIYRYNDNIDVARTYYERSQNILTKLNKYQDWLAQANAGLGAALYRSGIRKRKLRGDLKGAIADQRQAYKEVSESLRLVREFHSEAYLMVTLNRMADIFVEAHQLNLDSHNTPNAKAAANLRRRLGELVLVEEKDWTELRDRDVPFGSLDLLGQAQRLYELAFLQANKMNEQHEALDYILSAARVSQQRGRLADLDHYAAFAGTLRGSDDPTQERIFFALLQVLRAHLTFARDPEAAIQTYGRDLAELDRIGGFGWYLGQEQLPDIEKNLTNPSLSKDLAQSFCEKLARAWQGSPRLLSFVAGVQELIMAG